MARRVFFSFHFERDIWRVNQVRNCNVVAGCDAAGFYDHSEYEEAKRKGEAEVKRLIREKLDGTSVTIVLIGAETAQRPYVQYEIEQSIARNNGLLGIHIHHIPDPYGRTDYRGAVPTVPWHVHFPTYDWDKNLYRLRDEIEAAAARGEALRNQYVAAFRL